VNGNIDNSANLLPSGLNLILSGNSSRNSATITCTGNENFNLVSISKTDSGDVVTIGANCVFPLGNNPTSNAGSIINNGTVNVGTGIWTINSSYTQTSSTASTSFLGTKIDINDLVNDAFGYPGNLTLTGGSFYAPNMTDLEVNGNIDNSANLLPSGLNLSILGNNYRDDTNINCGLTNFSNFTINKTDNGAETKFASNCNINNFTRTDGPVLNSDSPFSLFIYGNLSFSNTDAFGGSNLTIKLVGNNNQIISRSADFSLNSPIQVDKTGGYALLNSYFIFPSSVDILKGIFDLNGNYLVCNSNFTIHNGGILRLIGVEKFSSPLLNSGSKVIYKGDGDSQQDIYYLKNFSYKNLSIESTDNNDIFKNQNFSLDNNLILYYPLDEPSGTNITNDMTSYNHYGVITGTNSVAGKSNNARSFNGTTSDYVVSSSSNALDIYGTQPFSISLWFKINSLPSSYAYGLIMFGENGQNPSSWDKGIKIKTNGYAYGHLWDGATREPTNSTQIQPGNWYHAVLVYDGTNSYLYINGTAGSPVAVAWTVNFNVPKVVLSFYKSSYFIPTNGVIDEVYIFNKALTAQEVSSLYNNIVPPTQSFSLSVDENLNISSGVFSAYETINLGGDFINNGSFLHNNGTVVLNGSNQSIWGTTTFYNLSKQVNSSAILTFEAGKRQTILGALTLKGSANNLLTLQSSSLGSQWEIDPQGTRDLGYLAVRDSYNVNQNPITTAGLNITDLGNNTGWLFNSPPNLPHIDNYEDGSWTTDNTPTLQFDLSDPDSGDIIRYQIQIDDNSDFSSPVVNFIEENGSSTPRNNVTFTSPVLSDGYYYWRVRAIDGKDTESDWAVANNGEIAFKVDATPPLSFAPVVNPSGWTSNNTPTLTFSTTDTASGVDHYEVKIGEEGTYSIQSSPYIFPSQPDGQQRIYIKAVDVAGNERVETVDIFIDTAPPSGSILINSGNEYTSSSEVILTLNASDATSGVSQMIISENSDFSGSSWESYTTSKVFSLSSSEGSKTVYVKFKDNAGNISAVFSDSIILDTSGPTGVITINNGDNYTSSRIVTLSISASDIFASVLQMKISENSNFSAAVWESYTATKSYTLSSSEGTKTIYIKFKDSLGNESEVYSDSIIYDTTPPSLSLDSPGNESYINSERPSFKWKAAFDLVSGVAKYKLEIDNGNTANLVIDNIPSFRTTNYETNKYVIYYENFSDDNSGNNYLSVYLKSSSEWNQEENDGKLKEGKRIWKVTAYDNAGNSKEESRVLFVDKSGPSIEEVKINDFTISELLKTYDQNPTLSGKIIDRLNGDKESNFVASGPEKLEIEIKKRNNLGIYLPYALVNLNLDKIYWTTTNLEIKENNQNIGNKYSSFSYTFTNSLPRGIYQFNLKAKDRANNESTIVSFELEITSFEEFKETPEIKEIIEELEKTLEQPKEKIEEEIKKEEVVLPSPTPKPQLISKIINQSFGVLSNLWWKTVETSKNLLNNVFRMINISKIEKPFNKLARQVNNILKKSENLIRQPIIRGENLFSRLKVGSATFISIVFDKEPTRIYDVQIVEVTPTSAVITWKTNHYATSKINYGLSLQYGNEVYSSERVKYHRVILKNLEPGKTYYFEVMSEGKNYTYDAYYTFTTPKK
ncbi:MAG: LamG-like jellyroll fold domain-containing protein, partial [Microgenomates group bacterium]